MRILPDLEPDPLEPEDASSDPEGALAKRRALERTLAAERARYYDLHGMAPRPLDRLAERLAPFGVGVDLRIVHLDGGGLAGYKLRRGERVDVFAAQWLYAERRVLELVEPLTMVGWCTACGVGVEGIYTRTGTVRQWCGRCVSNNSRPWVATCEAPDCSRWWVATNGRERYCKSADCKRARDRQRKADCRRALAA